MDINDLKRDIENYVPVNEQEEKDKQIILKSMEDFDDVLTRENEYIHFTSSGFVVNKDKDKVLMIYHNIYNSWAWTGGHADGECDMLSVALREVEEETSSNHLVALDGGKIQSIDCLPVAGHVKRGKYVNAHIHISVAYIIEADENDMIKIKEDENSNVAWQDIDKVVDLSTEPHMKVVYKKLVEKVKQMK